MNARENQIIADYEREFLFADDEIAEAKPVSDVAVFSVLAVLTAVWASLFVWLVIR
jgi:hypothetical protein